MDTSSCMGPVINGKLQEFVLKAMMWTGSTQKTMDWVSEGTAVESEQGWFQLALYNLSNLFLMLTVQYSLYLTLEKHCIKKNKKHFFICYLNQNMVITDSELSFCRNGSHKVLFVTLQYIKTPFCSILQIQDVNVFKIFFFCTISILYNYTRSSSIMACGLKYHFTWGVQNVGLTCPLPT